MLAVHASGSHLGGGGVELYRKFIQAHTVSHPFGQMRQLTSIVFEGIPERFPHLRLAFLEAGVGWVPYWMGRMDEEYDKRGDVEAPALKKSPSEYVKSGNLYFSCEADEPLLPEALRLVGEDVVVYASDYPHWDNEFPGSIRVLKGRKDIADEQTRKILADNARRLYWSSSGGR
jgi:predicted TIM-barrel fold metal-dependent hydrolase